MNADAIAECHVRSERRGGLTGFMSNISRDHKGAITGSLLSMLLTALAWGYEAGKTREKFDMLISRVTSIEVSGQAGTPYSKETRWELDNQGRKITAVELKAERSGEQIAVLAGDVREIKVSLVRIEKALEKMSLK